MSPYGDIFVFALFLVDMEVKDFTYLKTKKLRINHMESMTFSKGSPVLPVISLGLGIGLLFGVTGCTPESKPSPEKSISASASASVQLPAANNGNPVNNGKGSYIQTTVDDNDPAMKYNSNIVSNTAKAKYSEAQLTQVQQAVVKFIAEQTIDSTVQGGGNSDEWFSKNKSLIAPEFQDEAKKLIANPKAGFLVDNPNRKDYGLKYGEKDRRVVSRSIEVTKIDLASKERPLVTANIEYALKTDSGKLEKASGKVSYAVTEVNGAWLISGYDSKVAIVPFEAEK